MILEMTNCTNCSKYKPLLTWSTFHFKLLHNSHQFSSVLKQKHNYKFDSCHTLHKQKHSTLSLITLFFCFNKRGVVYSELSVIRQNCPAEKSAKLKWSHNNLPPPSLNFLLDFPLLYCCVPSLFLLHVFPFKETYHFNRLPPFYRGEWEEHKNSDFKSQEAHIIFPRRLCIRLI